MRENSTPSVAKKIFGWIGYIFLSLLIIISFTALFSALWYRSTYGALGFDSILYTLLANTDGVESDLVVSWATSTLPKLLGCSVLVIVVFLVLPKLRKLRLTKIRPWMSVVASLLLCIVLLFSAAHVSELDQYIVNQAIPSPVYEEEYRDPKTTAITFPEQKRNLIYIYLESMETSYLSKEQGGMLDYNVIPELYTLAQENTNFSHNQDVGGFTASPGATWTIGAMVGQTAGIPLKTPSGIGGNDYGAGGKFLPGVTSLMDILDQNGYFQALMVGSDASFGGRRQYYTSHGIDRVYDLYSARAAGLVPKGYHVWWGFEDHYLFTYAKEALLDISQLGHPFAFTMLTVDTHHIDGYMCKYCENKHEQQYENVMECSSKQVDAFVRWLQEQPFYENTTVIITGDHPSMDNGYFDATMPENYQRHVYNCFMNSAVTTENTKNRNFATYDMFPTTLAAMGCTIDGDRLGFGTNLFSATPTLLEATNGAITAELEKSSSYYTKNFFFK